MLKFIFTTDSHGRGSNPASRLDNFPEAILGKFAYINKLAEELGCVGILHGGDWVETPDVANNFVRELTLLLANSKVPWYGILGNHDVYGQNPETFKKTPLGIAEAANAFTRLRSDPIMFFGESENAAITGKDSYFNIDKLIGREDYCNSVITEDAVNIHIVHGFLDDHKWMDSVDCTTIDEITECNADVVLTGHLHTAYGIIKRNGRIYCNPDALARVSASIGDVNNEVGVALITIDGRDVDIRKIMLPIDIAKPANEVLDRAKIVAEKEHKKQLETFTQNLSEVRSEDTFNVYHILNSVAEEDNIEDNIITLTRGQLEKAEEQLKKGD